MVLSVEQERVQTLIKDTITLLCRNGLSFKTEFSVEALIGVTVDKADVFLININELVKSRQEDKLSDSASDGDAKVSETSSRRRKRKRKIKVKEEVGSASDSDNDLMEGPHEESNTEQHINWQNSGKQNINPEQKYNLQNSDMHNISVDNAMNSRVPSLGFNCIPSTGDSSGDIIVIKEEVGEIDEDIAQDCAVFSAGPSGSNPGAQQRLEQTDFQLMGWSPDQMSSLGQLAGIPSSQDHTRTDAAYGYQCHICKKVLTNQRGLRMHLMRHAGHYSYHCPECNKGFSSTSMLKGHMSWHTGIKEFKCPTCLKEFRYKHEVTIHVKERHGQ